MMRKLALGASVAAALSTAPAVSFASESPIGIVQGGYCELYIDGRPIVRPNTSFDECDRLRRQRLAPICDAQGGRGLVLYYMYYGEATQGSDGNVSIAVRELPRFRGGDFDGSARRWACIFSDDEDADG